LTSPREVQSDISIHHILILSTIQKKTITDDNKILQSMKNKMVLPVLYISYTCSSVPFTFFD